MSGVTERFAQGDYPTTFDEAVADGWGDIHIPGGNPGRTAVPEGWLLSDFTQGGGGFGDPLERDPERVADDVTAGLVSAGAAEQVFGVPVVAEGRRVRAGDSSSARSSIRQERRTGARGQQTPPVVGGAGAWLPEVRFHEYLETGRFDQDGQAYVRCTSCESVLCEAHENYKRFTARTEIGFDELSGRSLPDGSGYLGVLHEYACPQCGVLLCSDVYCPQLSTEEDLWDVQLSS